MGISRRWWGAIFLTSALWPSGQGVRGSAPMIWHDMQGTTDICLLPKLGPWQIHIQQLPGEVKAWNWSEEQAVSRGTRDTTPMHGLEEETTPIRLADLWRLLMGSAALAC
eukprot:4588298-Amphidinium_carterae.1